MPSNFPAREHDRAGADNYPGRRHDGQPSARLPMSLYGQHPTGEVKTFHHAADWLNHVKFSPTDGLDDVLMKGVA